MEHFETPYGSLDFPIPTLSDEHYLFGLFLALEIRGRVDYLEDCLRFVSEETDLDRSFGGNALSLAVRDDTVIVQDLLSDDSPDLVLPRRFAATILRSYLDQLRSWGR